MASRILSFGRFAEAARAPVSNLRGQDAWRKHPIFQWTWVDALPGIREGTAAFVIYCLAETLYEKAQQGSSHEAHGHAAHGHAAHAAEAHSGSHAAAAKHH